MADHTRGAKKEKETPGGNQLLLQEAHRALGVNLRVFLPSYCRMRSLTRGMYFYCQAYSNAVREDPDPRAGWTHLGRSSLTTSLRPWRPGRGPQGLTRLLSQKPPPSGVTGDRGLAVECLRWVGWPWWPWKPLGVTMGVGSVPGVCTYFSWDFLPLVFPERLV